MSQCACCGKELHKVLSFYSSASKTFMRKEGYDGAEFEEAYSKMVNEYDFKHLPEPYEVESPFIKGVMHKYVKFSLCMRCSSGADWGQKVSK